MKNLKKNKIASLFVAAVACMGIASCNSSEEVVYTLPSSATVRSFSLEANKNILPGLDSVFFSIDLYNRQIFNADSLPYGTRVTGLVPVITVESASSIEITMTTASGETKTVNYLENTTDTIDFTNPVMLKVVSYDRATTANYTVTVNVHKVVTDTLVWSKLEGATLPTLLSGVTKQHTTMSPDGIFYCMTEYNGNHCIAYTDDPSASWQTANVNFDFVPNLNTFTASTDALYILSESDELFTSEDNGLTWTSTGENASWIIGCYGNKLLSTRQDGETWYIDQFPNGTGTMAPKGFPVVNTSNATTVKFEMSTSEQLMVTGGRKADGNLTADTWGFDGTTWIDVSRTPLPVGLENMAVVPYFELQRDTIGWRVKAPQTVLLGLFGNDAESNINTKIYMSSNFGLTWTEAPESMQIPANILPARNFAQAYPYVATATATAKIASKHSTANTVTPAWKEIGRQYVDKRKSNASRATQPITEWDVPYIYIFGGENKQGVTYNTIFRGVIVALTQKPLQ